MATKQVDMIAQVGKMLQRMSRGEWSNRTIEATAETEDEEFLIECAENDRVIVVASAILAVAGELREINNSLAALASPDKTLLTDGAA